MREGLHSTIGVVVDPFKRRCLYEPIENLSLEWGYNSDSQLKPCYLNPLDKKAKEGINDSNSADNHS